VDYRKLLGKVESAVLPYFGGGTVDAPSRRLRVPQPVAAGWWRFELKGREATAREPASPEGLEALPRVRGHLWGTRLVREGAVAEALALMPEEEPPRLSPVTARRWHDGTLLFEGVEFESEAEESARHALEEDRPLGDARGVSASLRAAFGFAVLEATSRATGIPFAPVEARAKVLDVAREGRGTAERCLRALADERVRYLRLREEQEAPRDASARAAAHRLQSHRGGDLTPGERFRAEAEVGAWVERALDKAGARLLSHRRLGDGLLEVVYTFMGERFVTVVEAATLRVRDAGVCLAGADARVTLESLPSVLKEAMETDALVITRHV
jgi:hypothetical protein